MTSKVNGSCFCGKLKFHYELPSKYVAHCHCNDCRRAHGAGYVTWVGLDSEQLHLDDDSTLKWHGELETGRRGFCGECGSSLFIESKYWVGEIAVSRSNLHGEIDKEPAQHAFYDLRVGWIPAIDDDLEQLVTEDMPWSS